MVHIIFVKEMIDEASRQKVKEALQQTDVKFDIRTDNNSVTIYSRGNAVRTAILTIEALGYNVQ